MSALGGDSLASPSTGVDRYLSGTKELRWAALGILFLLFCGWKLTFGLDHVLDLRLGDETKYLAYGLGYTSPADSAEWSPLYFDLYRLEHLLIRDPIDLYFFHQKLMAAVLPISLFVYFACRRVPFVLAIGSCTYFLISAANVPVEPKTMHLALALMFLFLSIFIQLDGHPARWAVMLVGSALLSLLRPEYAIALAAFLAYSAYLVFATRAKDRPLLVDLAIGLFLVAALYVHYGFPLSGGRSVFAFAQHFALNYSAWNYPGQDPWAHDYRQIFNSVFHHAGSIAAAFMDNPWAFLHHVASNIVHAPVVVAGLLLAHLNLVLPRFEVFTLAEAVLLPAALVTFVILRRFNSRSRIDLPQHASWRSSWSASRAAVGRTVRSLPDAVCLAIFLLPFAVMIAVLYPRHHYVLAFDSIVFATAVVIVGRRIRHDATAVQIAATLAVLSILVPCLGSAGARVDLPIGEVSTVPRPALQTANFLRGLDLRAAVVVCSSVTPGAEVYAGGRFRSVSALDKHQRLTEFLNVNDIGVIVEDDRMRHSPAFAADPEWSSFQSMPEKFGFTAHVLADAGGIVVYVRQDIAVSSSHRRSSAPL
jgi:hypothetical protein